MKILVIGAGLTRLCCAMELYQQGFDVTIVEEQQEIELRENQSFEAHLKEFLAKIS